MATYDQFKRSLITQESNHDYSAVNKRTGALGFGQVMPQNLTGWGKNAGRKNFGWDYDALGRDVTPQEFLTNPALQEKIVDHQLKQAFNKYGAEGAARWWYSNSPNASNKKPAENEPSPNQYAAQVTGRMGYSGGGGGGGKIMPKDETVSYLVSLAQQTKQSAAPAISKESQNETVSYLVSMAKQPQSASAAQQKPAFVAIDPRKEAEKEYAKTQGKTKPWESALLGFSNLGAGIVQGATYAADAALGTNLYDKFTNSRKDVIANHELRREVNGQGFDGYRLAGDVAGTLPVAALARGYQGAKIISQVGGKVAAQNAAVGAMIGGGSFANDAGQRGVNIGAGALGGAAGGAIGQKLGQAITAVRTAASPAAKQQAAMRLNVQIEQEFNSAINQAGINVGDLSQALQQSLKDDVREALLKGKSVDAQSIARKTILDKLGLQGTKAQVSGKPQDWQKQAELAKIQGAGDPLREKLVKDNENLANLLGQVESKTGGRASDQFGAMQSAKDALLQQTSTNKDYIRLAYDAARTSTGNTMPIDAKAFIAEANQRLTGQYANYALPKSVQSLMKNAEKNGLTLGDSEELIKALNREYSAKLNPNGSQSAESYAIDLVRKALDKHQQTAVDAALTSGQGNQAAAFWQTGRQAAQANFKRTENNPLLKAVLDGKEPDKLFKSYILNGDVNSIKTAFNELSNTSPQAVADIKQQVIQHISNKAINQSGQFSPAGMKRALDGIGDRRLLAMFTPQEVTRLRDIGKAAQYLVTQPAHSYVNNSNTASALMNHFGSLLGKPGVRVLLSPVKDIADSQQVKVAMKAGVAGEKSNLPSVGLSGAQKQYIEMMAKRGVVVTPEMLKGE